MRNCNEISQLISESHDRKLSLSEKITLKAHLLCCLFCRRYKKRIQLICKLIKNNDADRLQCADICMKQQTKEKIRTRLSKEMNTPSE